MEQPPAWWQWLGITDRSEGFDPGVLAAHPAGQNISLALRLARSCILVPLVEEICWRAWLMRFVIANGRDFRRVPFGTHAWKAFWITTLAVTLAHQPADWAAAFVWGALMYGLAVRTRSLTACALMHALGNLMLGAYILRTGQNGYW
jgi:CAAX prenyl protease-like protein